MFLVLVACSVNGLEGVIGPLPRPAVPFSGDYGRLPILDSNSGLAARLVRSPRPSTLLARVGLLALAVRILVAVSNGPL